MSDDTTAADAADPMLGAATRAGVPSGACRDLPPGRDPTRSACSRAGPSCSPTPGQRAERLHRRAGARRHPVPQPLGADDRRRGAAGALLGNRQRILGGVLPGQLRLPHLPANRVGVRRQRFIGEWPLRSASNCATSASSRSDPRAVGSRDGFRRPVRDQGVRPRSHSGHRSTARTRTARRLASVTATAATRRRYASSTPPAT